MIKQFPARTFMQIFHTKSFHKGTRTLLLACCILLVASSSQTTTARVRKARAQTTTPAPAPTQTQTPTPQSIVLLSASPTPSPSPSWSSAVEITKGGTYSGNWRSSNPDIPAVKVLTNEPVVIQNCMIESVGDGIWSLGFNSNLTVRNCQGKGINPNLAGRTKGHFINIGNFSQAIIEQNTINSFGTGIRALNYGSAATQYRGQKLIIRYNIFNNVDGRFSDGNGGYLNEYQTSFGQAGSNAIGLNTLRGANVEIGWNQVINQPYLSSVEDMISTYGSSGTPTTPIVIHNNYLQGGYAPDPKANVSYSGAMINVGDDTGDVGYVQIFNNQVVSFENNGILISAGSNNQVHQNRVISSQKAPDGTVLGGIWRSALVLWDFYKTGPAYWHHNVMSDNSVNVVKNDGNPASDLLPGVGGTNQVTGTTDPLGHLATEVDLLEEYKYWTQKIAGAGVRIGSQN